MVDIRSPDGTVSRTIGDGVEAEPDALVLAGIVRLVGLHIGVPLAVAVGVDDERRPALRLGRVAGFPEQLRVHPADDGQFVLEIVAEPQRVVGILGKIQMVRPETRVNERELRGLRVVHRDLAGVLHEPGGGAREWVHPRRRIARRGRAIRWRMLGRTALCRVVDPPVLIHHRVMRVNPRIPHLFCS